MDKKGSEWSVLIIIIIILISTVIIIGLWIVFKENLIEVAQTNKEKLLEAFKS